MRSFRSASKHITYFQHYKPSSTLLTHTYKQPLYQTYKSIRLCSSSTTTSTSSRLSFIPTDFNPDQRILNLFYGFVFGIAFSALYNREFPGYERRIRRKAAKGSASAMVEYGELLMSLPDNKRDRNVARSFKLFQSSSEQGNKTAHYYLGLLHKMKLIEAPNPKAAFHHFTVAANDGDENNKHNNTIDSILKLQSKFELATCYLEGYGADRDIKIGLDMLENIGSNNGDAAFMLSQIYCNGRYGIPVNSVKSLSWKKQAANLGNKIAIKQMNELYLSKGRDIIDKEVPNIKEYDGIKSPV